MLHSKKDELSDSAHFGLTFLNGVNNESRFLKEANEKNICHIQLKHQTAADYTSDYWKSADPPFSLFLPLITFVRHHALTCIEILGQEQSWHDDLQ